jgi:hypothetical protein
MNGKLFINFIINFNFIQYNLKDIKFRESYIKLII